MNGPELLALIRSESGSAIGLDNDETLRAERERSLKYYRGEMADLPSLPNRSKAVSTDVADAIDTLHPDIVEIFTGGDDVMSFIPIGPEDEEQAQQETDYVNHVFFNENPGWQIIHDITKDALQVKIGVAKAWVEECGAEEESFEGKTALEMQASAQNGEVSNVSEAGEGLFNFTVTRPAYRKVKVASWPPEDFAVAKDTVRLSGDGFTYCKARSRQRAQDLILQGFEKAKVDQLSSYEREDDRLDGARDTAGEDEVTASGQGDLRTVEIENHIIRVTEGGKAKLYSVVTGENATVLLAEPEEVSRNPYSAICPYPMPHRFYGESVADRVWQNQKVRSALKRMMLDSGYYANNQRHEVAEQGANENTIPDLLNNQPGGVVRVKTAGTVNPLQAGALNFDVFAALEYEATAIEQRTGITRAAQGLAPDTLHETAKGALALLTAAQKRVRLMARVFAEGGIRDLFLTVHGLLRENSDRPIKARLKNRWVEIDPTSWGNRTDMQIEIGLGASGREADLMALSQEAAVLEQVVTAQGGPSGPIVGFEQIYNQARRTLEKLGNKAPEKVLQDPAEAPPQPPKPDPDMVKVEKDAELKRMELQGRGQLQAIELQGKGAIEEARLRQSEEQAIREHDLKVQQMQAEIQLKREIAAAELQLKRELLQAELQMKRELNAQQAQIARENNFERNSIQREASAAKIDAQVNVGGDPG